MDRFEKWLIARGVVITWWSPGEYEDDLQGFVSAKERDAFEAGKPGPFRRIIRNHHKLGPIPPEVLAVREIYRKRKS